MVVEAVRRAKRRRLSRLRRDRASECLRQQSCSLPACMHTGRADKRKYYHIKTFELLKGSIKRLEVMIPATSGDI